MKKITLSLLLCYALSIFSANAKPSSVASFDDLTLSPESHFPGNWTEVEDSITSFISGDYSFKTYAYADWMTWAFYGYSNETATTYTTTDDQFRNVVGSGVNGSANYSIIYASSYMGYSSIYHKEDDTIKPVPGAYITNTPWVEDVVLNGDALESAFTTGDSLVIKINGLINEEVVSSVTYFLADYRSNDSTEHYYLKTWEWIDLSSLDSVDEIRFEVLGSRNGIYGLNTPQYLALDDFGASCPERSVDTLTNNSALARIAIQPLTIFSADANIKYSILEQNNAHASIVDGNLNVIMSATTGDILIHAVSKGINDFIRIPLSVILEGELADFENINLNPESHIPGNATTLEDQISHFFSGKYEFSSFANSAWGTTSNFAVSNETSTEYTSLTDQFRNVVGSGANSSTNYSIVYIDAYAPAPTAIKQQSPAVIPGMYITNSAFTASVITNGDNFGSTPFAQGDSLILTVYAYTNGVKSDSIALPLADYRTPNEHYSINSWQWIDLSPLGATDEVRFVITGSQNGVYGLNTPTYFALDNFGASCPEINADEQLISTNANINLTELTTFNAKNGAISFSIIEKDDNINTASISGENLNIGMTDGEASILVMAFQRGNREYIRIPLRITTNVDATDSNSIKIWTNDRVVNILSSHENYSVELFNALGVRIYSTHNCQGLITIPLNLNDNIFIVRTTANGKSTSQRIIVK